MTINDSLGSAAIGAEQPVENPSANTTTDPMEKYNQERAKRIRSDGLDQYIDLVKSDEFKQYYDDPWAQKEETIVRALKDGDHCKYLILGAGYAGLLFAIDLVKIGVDVKQIRIVDPAGGFGGTWYWNRYPGLMCDVESYIYLPLLEETGYMPKHKYSFGPEILEYANLLAEKFNLKDSTAFQMAARSLSWDDTTSDWVVNLTQGQTSSYKGDNLTVRAQFVFAAGGVLNNPKLPGIQGIHDFKGQSFHTSRWDYNITGGTPSDPSLMNLQGKSVGIIGTGATCVQALPYLAKYAKEVYVFQRTPSSVDERNNKATDPSLYKAQIANKEGWQRERVLNFHGFLCNAIPKPKVDMVDDGWTAMPTFSALVGGPAAIGLTREMVPAHVGSLNALDYPRQERVRQRVASIVHDQSTAEKLKPYYPTWCKRPCFHDEFLPCFNLPNVHLIDTDGKGVDKITPTSLVANGTDYPLDVLIFGTGFRPPAVGSPAARSDMTVTGRNGASLDEKWETALATLHGMCSRDFPNLFWPGVRQATASANQMFVYEVLSKHVAFILKTVEGRTGGNKKIVVEPSKAAEEEWSMRILSMAAHGAAMVGCTPGYLNVEGMIDKVREMGQEAQIQAARGSLWGAGPNDFARVMEEWEAEGSLKGIEVTVV